METKVEDIQNYHGYIKCGEILKSPTESYQCPYVLKCFQCKGTYLLLESFIFHIEVHCNEAIGENGSNTQEMETDKGENVQTVNSIDMQEMDCDGGSIVKQEEFTSVEMEDPLVCVKSEVKDDEGLQTKNISNLPEIPLDSSCNIGNLAKKRKHNSIDGKKPDECDEVKEESSDESSSDEMEFDDTESEDYEPVKNTKSSRYKSVCTKRIKIKEFMKSQLNVSALISAYKNKPALWNKSFPFLRHKEKRQEYLEQIAEELKYQANLDMTWEQVSYIIVYICQKYQEDLKGLKANEDNDDKKREYTPAWYFEELHFLKSVIENNLIAKLNSNLPELLPHEITKILEIYKGLPHLWNTQIIEYYCKNKKQEAIKEMLQSLETNLNIKISEQILDEYLRTVHHCFSMAKRKQLNIIPKRKLKDICDIERNKQEYYENMNFLQDHVGPFKCPECDVEIKSALSFKIHLSEHNGSAPLSCSVCNRKFTSSTTYINHARRHMEDTHHDCKECGKKFYGSRELNIHMRDHTGAKPFCCEICGASFRHVQGFTNHRRRHDKNYLHTCHICSKGYYTMDRYKDHMNAHTNTRTHICSVCGKAFINKKGLQQHAVIHEDIRRYACKLCGKTFKHKTGVSQHMRTHGVAKCEENTVNKGLDIM